MAATEPAQHEPPPMPIRLEVGRQMKGMEEPSPYEVQEELRAGRHGCSYRATDSTGQNVFLKIPLVDLAQNLEHQHARSIRIFGSFLKEYRNRKELADVAGVAHIVDAGHTDVEGRLVPFLVQEYVDGTPLETYLAERYGAAVAGEFAGIPSSEEWFRLSREILQVIRRVHNRFVVHGDIWPPNILMVDDHPILVDFGQSFIIDDYPDEPAGRIRQHPYLAPERVAVGRRWDMSADIYSIGGLLLYLATGQAPFAPIEDVEALKERVHGDILDLNPGLLRANMGITKIIDKCMRYDVVDRYPYVDDVLDALDLFDYERDVSRTVTSPETLIEQLDASVSNLKGAPSSLFNDLAVSELALVSRQIDGMARGHHILTADREELINSLLRYLRVLKEGDEYLTVTVPAFWSPENLGVNGRFLTLNQMMAQKGVVIRRIFLLCDEDRDDPEVMKIVRAHLRAMEEVQVDGVRTTDRELPSASRKSWWTGYVLLTSNQRADAIASRQHVAVWRKPATEELMSITFSQRPGTGQIGKVRFWSSPRLQPVVEQFRGRIRESRPLGEFPRG